MSRMAGSAAAIACAACVAVSITFSKLALASVPAFTAIFYLATLALAITAFFRILKPRPLRLSSVGVTHALIHGLLATIGIVFSWLGLLYMSAPASSFIGRTEVLVSTLTAFFFLGERLRGIGSIGFALGMLGAIIMTFPSRGLGFGYQENELLGISLTLLGALGFGLCEIFGKLAVKSLRVLDFMLVRNILSALVLLTLLLAVGERFSLARDEFFYLLGAALFGPVGARAFFMVAVREIPLTYAVGLNQSQPLFTAFFAAALAMDLPTGVQWVGGSMIVVGCLLIVMVKTPAEVENAPVTLPLQPVVAPVTAMPLSPLKTQDASGGRAPTHVGVLES